MESNPAVGIFRGRGDEGACVCSEATTSQKLGADSAGDGLVPTQLHLVGEEVEGVRTLGG